MITVIQPIFAPDIIRFQYNLNSLLSLHLYLRKYNITSVRLLFGGWNYGYYSKIKEYINFLFDGYDYRIMPFNRNCGKAAIVNMLCETYVHDDCKYIFTLDSDIQFSIECPDIISRLSARIDVGDIGGIALSQKECNVHLDIIHQNEYSFNNDIYCYSDNGLGAGGGCLFLSKEIFYKIGKYREFGSYGPDDAHLLVDMMNNNTPIHISRDVYIIHPFETDERYQSWKCNTVASGVNYDDAERFWF